MLFHMVSLPSSNKSRLKSNSPKKERSMGPFKHLLFTGLMIGMFFIPASSLLSHPTEVQRFLISDAEKKSIIASFEKGMTYSFSITAAIVIGASVLWGISQISQKKKP